MERTGICGAENGARTRDLNLGKVALYQLSYFRAVKRPQNYIFFFIPPNFRGLFCDIFSLSTIIV